MSLRSDAENDIQSLIDYFDNEPIVHFNGYFLLMKNHLKSDEPVR